MECAPFRFAARSKTAKGAVGFVPICLNRLKTHQKQSALAVKKSNAKQLSEALLELRAACLLGAWSALSWYCAPLVYANPIGMG